MVGVNKYRIDEEDGDNDNRHGDGDGDGNGNEWGEDATGALRIDNAAVRESQMQRLVELRSNRDENEVREALGHLERSVAISEDDNNDDNGINNRNNRQTAKRRLQRWGEEE